MGGAVNPRHKWSPAESQWDGQAVERCAHCSTERTRDTATRSLYLYRRGRAISPRRKPLGDDWAAFIAGVIPKCPGPEVKPC